eukprot:GHVQ01031051.1.p1 GENE.GHVQ01031051.1~~GHVQ01031051.1.p1  ORF type:complete len:113 (-),score=5.64 GHVQ01031051.1:80-418(-)
MMQHHRLFYLSFGVFTISACSGRVIDRFLRTTGVLLTLSFVLFSLSLLFFGVFRCNASNPFNPVSDNEGAFLLVGCLPFCCDLCIWKSGSTASCKETVAPSNSIQGFLPGVL